MTPRLIDAILVLVPGAQVVIRGDGADAEIEWHVPAQAPVTDAQIQAQYEAMVGAAPAADARKQRDALLSACDWTQIGDVPDTVDKEAWATYRQALRDLPKQSGFPLNIIWPTEP